MTTATFKPYDLTNSEADLHAHNGKRVTVLETLDLGHDAFVMWQIVFPDGTKGVAFENELTDWA